MALTELAPEATFCAGGRKVTIDQVDLPVAEVEEWRFCAACNHARPLHLEGDPENCTHCGAAWSDPDQKLRLLRMRQVFETALRRAGFETYPIKRGDVEDPSQLGVRLATMHRVKGLEFDRMVVAGVNAQLVPYKLALEETSDHAVRADVEARERSLLYVAVTRARRGVLITAHDAPSAWLAAAGAAG